MYRKEKERKKEYTILHITTLRDELRVKATVDCLFCKLKGLHSLAYPVVTNRTEPNFPLI